MTEEQKALNYYRSAFERVRPDYVPSKVALHEMVQSDLPTCSGDALGYYAEAGEHDCESNKYGAISVRAVNGKMLGLRPGEFKVTAWRPNTGQPSIVSRMGVLALAAALLVATPLHAAEPEPQPAPIVGRAVAVVVIVGGGWVIVKLRNFCKRHFPRGQTNSPPEQFQVAGEVGEYGALFNYELSGSCEVQAERGVVGSQPQRPVPTVFTMAIVAESPTNVSVTMRADVGEQFVQDVTGWSEEMASHGLFTFGHETASYERNRHPCDAEQVPITFDPDTRTVTLEPGGIVITVEHSPDLRQWEPLLIINVAQGTRLLVPDASEGMGFYRVSVKEP